MAEPIIIGDDVDFDRDSHAYMEGADRRVSVTQAIKLVGLIDYSMVRPEVLRTARDRGQRVHQATAMLDRGESPWEYEIGDIEGYVQSWCKFVREFAFIPDQDWIERPMIVSIYGQRVGMTPDAVGTIDRVPTVIERKATAAVHPCWGVQTAGYCKGLQAAGLQIRQRIAVQLKPTGTYRAIPHEDPDDFDTLADCLRLAAWKRKHRLVELD